MPVIADGLELLCVAVAAGLELELELLHAASTITKAATAAASIVCLMDPLPGITRIYARHQRNAVRAISALSSAMLKNGRRS
ncbi:MAG TPA: hypothetical protein VEF71_19310 [Streptosporangiaceae bacterium]|nr:hypothetical protein [Streptosporangiaceae bacterium]